MTGEDADKDELKTLALGFALGKYLCFEAYLETDEDAIPIPATAPYVATKTFVAGTTTDAAFPPGKVEHELGYIKRDGTTIRLSYLTQFSAYNQRIVIVNRGRNAPYTFTFMAEDDVMVTPGRGCQGDAAGQLDHLSEPPARRPGDDRGLTQSCSRNTQHRSQDGNDRCARLSDECRRRNGHGDVHAD